MNFNVVVSPNAEKDLTEICNYYQGISPNLRNVFLDSLEIRLKNLSVTPLAAAIRYANIRCTLIKKFPYLIHYIVNENEKLVIVLRVFSTHQKPLWNKD
jgi:plasmid stabilization system protein ParE